MTHSGEDKMSKSTESGFAHTKFGQVAHQIEPERDLEYYIETLRRLDAQRKDSGKLRDYGIDVIKHWLEARPTIGEPFSPRTVSSYARIIGYLHDNSVTPSDDMKNLTKDLKNYLNETASGLIHSDDSQIGRSSPSSHYESRNCRQRHASRSPPA
jgi:hypothetical protein